MSAMAILRQPRFAKVRSVIVSLQCPEVLRLHLRGDVALTRSSSDIVDQFAKTLTNKTQSDVSGGFDHAWTSEAQTTAITER